MADNRAKDNAGLQRDDLPEPTNSDWDKKDYPAWRWGKVKYHQPNGESMSAGVWGWIVHENTGSPNNRQPGQIRCIGPTETMVIPFQSVINVRYTDDPPEVYEKDD